MKETDKAYIAGIIDGEGCVSVTIDNYRKNTTFGCVIRVTNTDKKLLRFLIKTTKVGKIILINRKNYTNRPWKAVYAWRIGPKNIRKILPLILPYLILKKRQAELMLENLSLVRGQGYGSHLPLNAKKRRIKIAAEMKKLNKRGT